MTTPNTNLANSGEKKELSKRMKQIVDKLNNGFVLIVTTSGAWIRKDGEPDESLQFALFWRMGNLGIIYQEKNSPFDFKLSAEYNSPTNQ